EHEREQRRTERHLERLLAAVEQAEELVPAERAVGAQDQERVRRALGRLRLVDRILLRDGREIVEGGDARPRTRGLVVDVDRVREGRLDPIADSQGDLTDREADRQPSRGERKVAEVRNPGREAPLEERIPRHALPNTAALAPKGAPGKPSDGAQRAARIREEL